jgi:hypothetical protein
VNVQAMCSGPESLVPGTLRGYRTWRVGESGLLLRSTDHGIEWERVMAAECRNASFGHNYVTGEAWECFPIHPAPDPACFCGIYGWYRPDESRLVEAPIFGVIAASGHVLLGDFGFRAEKATILAVQTDDPVVTERCEAAGIAVYTDRAALVSDYPPDDVRELLVGHDIPETPPDEPTGSPWPWQTVQLHAGKHWVQMQVTGLPAVVQAHLAAMQRQMDEHARVCRCGEPTPLPGVSEPATPAERALAAVRNRNTGPKPNSRAPRSIQPRGAVTRR